MVPDDVRSVLQSIPRGLVVALTGAGVSAESGIPTFRGKEGYWQIGSRHYQPQEMATFEAFSRMPDEVWAWYLYRRGVCLAAEPNPAHVAFVRAEEALGEDFLLVTQNVDGLHWRAGSRKIYEIHGQIDRFRCANECSADVYPMPEGVDVAWDKARKLGEKERSLLVCPRCQSRGRPHVLWFDESYDEARYRFSSTLSAVDRAELLIVAGTSGATNLPHQMVQRAAHLGRAIVVLNADPSPFSQIAEASPRGAFWQGLAAQTVPATLEMLLANRARTVVG